MGIQKSMVYGPNCLGSQHLLLVLIMLGGTIEKLHTLRYRLIHLDPDGIFDA